MKKTFNKVPKLKTENGTLNGGFGTLTISQIEKIKGGKRRDTNDKCDNAQLCQADNSGCTNHLYCY
jgi:hypothetical protein